MNCSPRCCLGAKATPTPPRSQHRAGAGTASRATGWTAWRIAASDKPASIDLDGSYAFVEQVGPATLHFVGTAAATFSDQGIVATFDGSVVFRGASVVECRAVDHRLEFVR